MKLIHKKGRAVSRRQKANRHYNVIVVDWSERALNLFINKVSANAIVVGRELRQFIRNIGRFVNVFYNKLHHFNLIGHSFGAQICGVAGAEVRRFLVYCEANSCTASSADVLFLQRSRQSADSA